ncbi:hypothetical protein [Desulfosporosinus meridiei]|uniref:hypothetical protein n=1 Tax=Desulfosporosinus meridiei TaxID=79209 RepID=UPI000231310C|nr:hypothetical protein [Desulfosporosinus meridiei]
MKKIAYPERVRTALHQAIRSITADLPTCVKRPGQDFSRERKLSLHTMLLMLVGMGGNSLSKELYDWLAIRQRLQPPQHLSNRETKFVQKH